MARARPVSGLHPRATLLENARAIVAVRVAEMFALLMPSAIPAEDEDLHNMRIAAKRLRYTLEMFQVCLGPDGPDLIETVKEIQERIGSIHDADVLAELVRLRLAVVAHRGVEALSDAAGSGDEAARVAAVRAVQGATRGWAWRSCWRGPRRAASGDSPPSPRGGPEHGGAPCARASTRACWRRCPRQGQNDC